MNIRIGFVGHGEEKFTEVTSKAAKDFINSILDLYDSPVVVSGHSPMGGVDIYSEDIADERECEKIIHAPRLHVWKGQGYGFKDRNEDIGRDSEILYNLVVKDYPPNFKGTKIGYDYHCGDRVPKHVKSGGCWTAWFAHKLKKDVIWVIFNEDGSYEEFRPERSVEIKWEDCEDGY